MVLSRALGVRRYLMARASKHLKEAVRNTAQWAFEMRMDIRMPSPDEDDNHQGFHPWDAHDQVSKLLVFASGLNDHDVHALSEPDRLPGASF